MTDQLTNLFVGAVQDTSQLRAELLAAVEQNKLEKARRILKAGVDANAVCDDKGRFPLHVAAFFGFTKMVILYENVHICQLYMPKM